MASARLGAHESAPGTPAPLTRGARGRLRRYPDRGPMGGVCAGLAEHFGVSAWLVRVVVALLVMVGGFGVAVYAIAWALIPVAPESAAAPRRPRRWRERVALVLGILSADALIRAAGVRFGENRLPEILGVVWPAVLGGCGLALVWRPTVRPVQGAAARRAGLRGGLDAARTLDAPRVIVGGVLVALASAGLLHAVGALHSISAAIAVVVAMAAVLSLLFVPWLVSLGRSASEERAARIREEERAELAAHLHDSVLQTLALIQRRAGDSREVAGLARRQERELRHWLLAGTPAGAPQTLAAALQGAAGEVEELHGVRMEVVTVGDAPLDPRLEAVVLAAREAMTNAAKFSGCEQVDLYAEVAEGRLEVFVRDRGVGFDPARVPADRRGLCDSILARMHRHRGSANIRSRMGEGTEVELTMAGEPTWAAAAAAP